MITAFLLPKNRVCDIFLPALVVTFFAMANARGEDADPPVLVRSFANVTKPAPPFADRDTPLTSHSGANAVKIFEPIKGETIAFLGGTNTFDQQRLCHLEAKFHLAWPEMELECRNLAWQGDTIFKQARPRYFYTKEGDKQQGSTPDTRPRTTPGIIILNFGKMESFAGAEGLPAFRKAYAELLDELLKKTNRLVLVGPSPFFPVGPAATMTEARNQALAKYVTEISKLAKERKLHFVNALVLLNAEDKAGLSTNGIHLSEKGHALYAEHVANELMFPATSKIAENAPLRQAIQRKNRLWQQLYHPTNWAFLFGDRQHVPASRDHVDTEKRWFVAELDTLPKLITEAETDIHRYAREATK